MLSVLPLLFFFLIQLFLIHPPIHHFYIDHKMTAVPDKKWKQTVM